MRPDEIVATEPVDFDDVRVDDWVMPAWPDHPEGPPWRVMSITGRDAHRLSLYLVGVRAPTVGPSVPAEWIVTRAAWSNRGSSYGQWLRLPGLRKLEELAGSGLLLAKRA